MFFTDNFLFNGPADSICISIIDTYIGITYYVLYTLKNKQLYVGTQPNSRGIRRYTPRTSSKITTLF